jgi:hypothetical protein
MVRARFLFVAVAGGLGLACGCTSLSQHPLLSKFHHGCTAGTPGCTCSESGEIVDGEGPALGDGAPIMATPPGAVGNIPPGLTPQNTMPPLAPAPRLVPQPQSQPVPYTPTKEIR